jgi:hypothetical protein
MTTEETLAPNFVKLDGRVASREDQKRALARLLIARTDLSAAQFALKTILTQMTKGLRDPLIYPLHTAAIICYARPFTRNKETGTLPATYSRFDSDEANAAHRDALDVRHKFVAHSDFDARRPRIYPAGWKVGTGIPPIFRTHPMMRNSQLEVFDGNQRKTEVHAGVQA